MQRGEEELVCTSVQIAQFGAVAALANTGSTSNKYTLAFYRDTGGIKNIRALSKSLGPAIIDKLSAAWHEIPPLSFALPRFRHASVRPML